jgi:hypothetical protein
MPTEAEELQVKEFLKRAEIRTMKKDLQSLRESDALKERYKIVNVKTLEEQRQEQAKKLQEREAAEAQEEKAEREKILEKNAVQERSAEKDLKQYATEQERQQIFLLESKRLDFRKQIDTIDKGKDPALKLEKNKFLLEKRNWEEKLNLIKEDNRKIDTEENFLDEKISKTNIPSEKKSLEQRRWEIEEKRKEIEKKTWTVEKQVQDIDSKISQIDRSLEQLAVEKNGLRDKVLGVDKSLRDIYSGVIARVEEKRRAEEEQKKTASSETAKIRLKEKEEVQRQQWTHSPDLEQLRSVLPPRKNSVQISVPAPVKKVSTKSFAGEEEARKKFMQEVEQATKK